MPPRKTKTTTTPNKSSTSRSSTPISKAVSAPSGTPHRESAEKQVSQAGSGKMEGELSGATWTLDATTLALALSAKTLKPGIGFSLDEPDRSDNYNIKIYSVALDKAVKSFHPTPLIESKEESRHYEPLAKFLNSCVAACKSALSLCEPGKPMNYGDLNFIKWDRPTKDGTLGGKPTKPDLAGANTLTVKQDSLWWRPTNGKRSSTMEIPVEVKADWRTMVKQAATYGRSLLAAQPLRQFSLVLLYQQVSQELCFLVFHAGGVTASPYLSVTNTKGQKDILQLFMSILSWETPADAGLPEWSNDIESIIQRYPEDQEGLHMATAKIYYHRLGKRGRGFMVKRLSPIIKRKPEKLPIKPLPVTPVYETVRRSTRLIAKKTSSGESSHTTSSIDSVEQSPLDKDRIGIHPLLRLPHFVPQHLEHFSQPIKSGTDDIVTKLAWVGEGSASVESKMFKECDGMFGVMRHFYSSIVHHKEGLPANNHLFLEGATFWPIFGSVDQPKLDRRVLKQHVTEFAGDGLDTVSDPEHLFVAIAHAALGYRSLIERGYQHRDISIGNVLWCKDAKTTKSVMDTVQNDAEDTDIRSRLRDHLTQHRIGDLCHGFVIDGDMAIHLEQYFAREDHLGTRSGTDEFMSEGLLESVPLNSPYLQSPVDDLWSFFFVAQWAAIYNNEHYGPGVKIPPKLELLRRHVTGKLRTKATTNIIGGIMTPKACGPFLHHCRPLFRDWHAKLEHLTIDWIARTEPYENGITQDPHTIFPPLFREFTDRGVGDLVEIVGKHYGGSLQGNKWTAPSPPLM